MNSVGFTGHRILSAEERIAAAAGLRKTVEELISRGAENFFAGGALGFDTLAAQAVLAFRSAGAKVRLHLLLPFPEQDRRWSPADKAVYRSILGVADSAEYFCDRYLPGVYHLRDRAIVERSEIIVAYLNRSTGGTAYTVSVAGDMGREIINLALP
ncbi:MAG: SLOG family protein [Clostridiales bacterium]|nr:SLOG family protein [Clostridiales bacterium]